jgi:hypothetical protein
MYYEHFIKDLSKLGNEIDSMLSDLSPEDSLSKSIEQAFALNPLFTVKMQKQSIHAILEMFLDKINLEKWVSPFRESVKERENVAGIIMAGNIPLVGFHDMLSGLAAGYRLEVKLSNKDKLLLPFFFSHLCKINKYWEGRVKFVSEMPEEIDVLIATGSDEAINAIGEQYGKIPKLLRGTRSGIALLNGNESMQDLNLLADDIFLYFGLGCRSVSSLLVPGNYSFKLFLKAAGRYSGLGENPDFNAAYKYNRALLKMRKENFIDGNFFLLREGNELPPPLSIVNIVYYSNPEKADLFFEENAGNIQVKLCAGEKSGFVSFGKGQFPSLTDYADNINTVEFLLKNCYIRIKN